MPGDHGWNICHGENVSPHNMPAFATVIFRNPILILWESFFMELVQILSLNHRG